MIEHNKVTINDIEEPSTVLAINNKPSKEKLTQECKVRKLCINISRNIGEEEQEEEITQNTLTSVTKLIYAWKNSNFIQTVDNEEKEQVYPIETNICEWISDMKVVGSERKQTHNFVTINTTKGIRELINAQVELLKKEELRISLKATIPEHTSKIRVIVGPNLEFA